MRVHSASAILAAVCVLLTARSLPGQPAPDRLTAPISDAVRISLPGNTHPKTAQLKGEELTSPIPMQSMVLVLKPDPSQDSDLAQLIAEQHDPKSANFHKFLSPADFGQRFGLSDNDIAKITSWLTAHGFKIDEIPGNHRSIVFSGNSDQVAAAFNTQIRQYTIGTESHIANASDPEIPVTLASAVHGVLKLHNFRHNASIVQQRKIGPALSTPQFTYGSSHYLAPADYATIYDLNPLYSNSVNGSGQSIAIVARSNVDLNDVATFRSQFGLPANQPKVTIVNSDPGLNGDEVEALLDTEWSGAVAPKATVNLVVASSTNTADGVDLSAQYIVNHSLAPVMSMSYGQCEAYLGSAETAFYNSLWQQAAAQGISVFVSSGDSGASGCNTGDSSSGSVRAVNGLCTSPYSVCVGGTEFADTTNPGQYWLPGNNPQQGSAQSYIPETVWNESGSNGGSGLWAGGGGASIVYTKPSWQAGSGVPNDNRRDVPDVSLTAAGHDGYLIVEGGSLMSVGGTSASSPSFAGLMALINQKTASPQGNPNPNFYALAAKQASGGAAIFHDIASGNNSVPGVTGFSAAAGYDLATGLGSVDANQLVTHWTDLSNPAPSLIVTPTSTAPSIAPGQSTAVALNIVTGGSFNSAVALSVSGAVSGLTATLSSSKIAAPGSGAVSLSIRAAPALALGTYNLTVSAIGGNLTSTATIAMTVKAAGTFTLSTTTNYYIVGQGNTGIMNFSITPSGGFSAPMTVSIPGLPAGMTATTPTTSASGASAINVPLTIAAAKTTPTGVYQLLVTVAGGGQTKTFPLQITVTGPSGCTLASSPASINLTAGDSLNVQISCGNVQGNFKSALALTVTKNVPGGVVIQQLNMQISPGTAGGTLAITSANTAAPGSYSIQVNAAVPDGFNQTITIPFVITAPSVLMMTPSAQSVTVAQGQSATVQLTARHSGSFASAVTLVAAGLPAGVTATLSPASFASPGDGTTTITLTASPNATPGSNYYFVVAGLAGNSTFGAPIGLVVTSSPGFVLTSSPIAASLQQGNTAAVANISIGSFTAGFNSAVTLSASGMPSGITASFSKSSLSGSGSISTLTIASSQSINPGSYVITVTGTSGKITRSIAVPVTITAAPNFSLTAVLPSASARQASTNPTATITIGTISGGFNAPVVLSASGMPAGMTATFSKSSLSGSGSSSVLTLNCSQLAKVGTYNITVTGTGAGVSTFSDSSRRHCGRSQEVAAR